MPRLLIFVNPMTSNQEDVLLAKQFETLFTKYFSAVRNFTFMILKSEEDAEDIAQDVFAKLWLQPELWADNHDIDNYIFAMAKHITINFIRHKKIVQGYQEDVVQKSLLDELFNTENPFDPIYYKEALLLIKLVLDREPEHRRAIFEMSRFKQMSNKEIAEALNISVRTVEQQIYRTLVKLKKIIFIAFFLYSV